MVTTTERELIMAGYAKNPSGDWVLRLPGGKNVHTGTSWPERLITAAVSRIKEDVVTDIVPGLVCETLSIQVASPGERRRFFSIEGFTCFGEGEFILRHALSLHGEHFGEDTTHWGINNTWSAYAACGYKWVGRCEMPKGRRAGRGLGGSVVNGRVSANIGVAFKGDQLLAPTSDSPAVLVQCNLPVREGRTLWFTMGRCPEDDGRTAPGISVAEAEGFLQKLLDDLCRMYQNGPLSVIGQEVAATAAS